MEDVLNLEPFAKKFLLRCTMGILFKLGISKVILIGSFGRAKKYFCSRLHLNQ